MKTLSPRRIPRAVRIAGNAVASALVLSTLASAAAIIPIDWGTHLTCHYQVASSVKNSTMPFVFSLAYEPQTLATFKEKMEKGVRLTIVHRAVTPDAVVSVFGCQVYYDLWDEDFFIQKIDANSYRDSTEPSKAKVIRTKSKDEAIQACFATQVSLAVPFHPIRVQTLVDPTNKEQMERTRRWLAQRGIGGNASIIGKALGSLIRLDHQTEFDTPCTASTQVALP